MFFERAYLFAPIINQQRYFARAAREPRTSESFSCLQHAMRMLAASMGSQFKSILPMLYTHTTGTLDAWDRNMLEGAVPMEIVQAQLLLALYEILKDDPRKGWTSAGRCFRMVQRAKLDKIDDPSTRRSCRLSEVEVEERRRTFWTAYALDRYANFVHEMPLALNDQMVSLIGRSDNETVLTYLTLSRFSRDCPLPRPHFDDKARRRQNSWPRQCLKRPTSHCPHTPSQWSS